MIKTSTNTPTLSSLKHLKPKPIIGSNNYSKRDILTEISILKLQIKQGRGNKTDLETQLRKLETIYNKLFVGGNYK